MYPPLNLENTVVPRVPTGYGGLFYGVYPALVTDNQDPNGEGRVQVKLPWSPDESGQGYSAWARLATQMAGSNRGLWLIPDTGDEVLIAFEAGDPRHPYVVGALWNGQDSPSEAMDNSNSVKSLRSRNGVKITLDDTDGSERLTLETPGGQKFSLQDGPGVIELQDSNGNSIKMEASGITVNAAAKITINASATVEVSAGMVNVSAGMSQFSGVVRADSVICNSIISASYFPGAGNIW